MRKNLQGIFAVLPRLEVVGEAKDGLETLQAIHVLKPDVLTLDIRMPRLSGIQVLQRIQKGNCKVIMLTALADDAYREKCRELRADRFFDKITELDQFVKFLGTM